MNNKTQIIVAVIVVIAIIVIGAGLYTQGFFQKEEVSNKVTISEDQAKKIATENVEGNVTVGGATLAERDGKPVWIIYLYNDGQSAGQTIINADTGEVLGN